jgi:hypothetical protein
MNTTLGIDMSSKCVHLTVYNNRTIREQHLAFPLTEQVFLVSIRLQMKVL